MNAYAYTLQFFFKEICKFLFLNVAKKAGFLDIGGNFRSINKKKIYCVTFFSRISFLGSSYSLQKASYTLQLLFKVIFSYSFLNFAQKKAGFWDIWGNFRPINKKKYLFWKIFLEFNFFGHPTAYRKLPTPYNSFSK